MHSPDRNRLQPLKKYNVKNIANTERMGQEMHAEKKLLLLCIY